MKTKKNFILVLIAIIIISLIATLNLGKDFIFTSAKPDLCQTVIIDAGHPE